MQTCKNCQTSLRPGAKFCPECGVPVPTLCSSCGASMSPTARFCGECGTAVQDANEQANPNTVPNIAVGAISDTLEFLNVTIESATATGPDKHNEFYIHVKFKVANVTMRLIQSLNISTQIFNENGVIVATDQNSYDEVIKPNGSAKFENYVHSVKAELLGNHPEKLQILLNASAAEIQTVKFSPITIPNDFYDIISGDPIANDGNIKILATSIWKSRPYAEEDPRIEVKICLQNLSKEYIPQAMLINQIFDKDEESLDESSSYEELVPGGIVTISVESQIPENKSDNCQAELRLDLYRQMAQGFAQFSDIDIEEAEIEEDDEENSGSKRIYIKTEPGGKVVFGALNDEQIALLFESIESEEMSEELLELRHNSEGNFVEYAGVVNEGEDGDSGNEGIIRVDDIVEIPKTKDSELIDGVYFVLLSLSKVSIEFEFEPSDGAFDSDKFSEISVPIQLPEFIEHDLYGQPSFNIVVGYQYDGEDLEEYDGDLVDRGYDDLIAFIQVKDSVPSLLYKNYNGEEQWGHSSDIQTSESDHSKRDNKTSLYFVNYNKASDASQVTWITDEYDISDCVPFIKYIRCDDGEEYQFLTSENNEIVSSEINDFEAVPVKGSSNQDYLLCYTASIRVKPLKNFPKFLEALDNSDNQVEVVLGFRDQDGNEIEDCYEEDNSESTEFILDDSGGASKDDSGDEINEESVVEKYNLSELVTRIEDKILERGNFTKILGREFSLSILIENIEIEGSTSFNIHTYINSDQNNLSDVKAEEIADYIYEKFFELVEYEFDDEVEQIRDAHYENLVTFNEKRVW